jgi:hypothetical protein
VAESFSVGEIAILVDNGTPMEPGCESYTGQEVEITSGRQFSIAIIGCWYYDVRSKDGVELEAAESSLRKRRPPREPTSTWDDVIVWHPRETSHV